jgi:hypothetical protein
MVGMAIDKGCYWETIDLIADWKHLLTLYCNEKKFSHSFEGETRAISLVDRTVYVISKSLYKPFDALLKEWKKFADSWSSDPITLEMGKTLHKAVYSPVAYEEGGMLGDLQNVIIPAIIESMESLPLPHIEISDPKTKTRLSLDQVYIPSSLFAPNSVIVSSSSASSSRAGHSQSSSGAGVHPNWTNRLHFSVSGMHGDIHNVRYALERQKWPSVQHQGLMSIQLGGHKSGLDVALDLRLNDQTMTRFEPEYVQIECSKIRLHFHENLDASNGKRTPLTLSLGRSYIEGRLRSRLERAICDRIVVALGALDALGVQLASF